VKRRICLAGTAIAVVPFAVGIGVTAATAKSTPPAKSKPPAHGKAPASVAVLKCHITLTTVPPPGSPVVNQPPSQGILYGQVHCPTASFGGGVESASFKVPDTGDTVGKYTQYFGDGSVHGSFDLTPQEGTGNLSSTSFASESWVGTVNLTGGTGAFAKAAGSKGVLKCVSGDTVHLRCTEKLPLTAL
jgi:hypothetical protein